MNEDEKQTAFKQALNSFNLRLGVDYMDLHDPEAQKIVRRNLDKEMMRIRTKLIAAGHLPTE